MQLEVSARTSLSPESVCPASAELPAQTPQQQREARARGRREVPHKRYDRSPGAVLAGVFLTLPAMLFGGQALAVCTVTGTGTLANLDAGDQVECTGTTNGEVIAGTGNGIQVSLADDFLNSSVSITGSAQIPTTRVDFDGNTNAAGSTVAVTGSNARIDLDGVSVTDIAGLSLTENSFSQSTLNIINGSTLTLASGSSVFLNGTAALDLSAFGANSLNADTTSSAAATVIGDAGNQTVRLLGTANAGANGVLVDLGAGDDVVELSLTSNVSGLIDAGAGSSDRLFLRAGTLASAIDGFEILETGNGQSVRVAAVDDFTEIRANGAISVDSVSYLGLANATITMSANGRIVYDAIAGLETLTQTLVNTGSLFSQRFEIDTGGELIVATNSPSFAGNWVITNGTLTLDPAANIGTGLIINNDVLRAGSATLPVTISNDISGGGLLEVAGGLVTLTGNNTYSGGSLIQQGTLSVQDTDALGTGSIDFNGGVTPAASILQLDIATGAQTLANQLTGSGTLQVLGGGELLVGGSNTFSGITSIAADTDLVATSDSALGTSVVQNDGRLALDDVQLGNTITGAGTVEAIGSGLARLSGTNTYTGGTSVVGGTLAGQADSFGSSSISLAADSTLLIESAVSQSVTLQNDLTGGGSVASEATGLISLTGSNDYSGGTRIGSGTLAGSVTSFGTGDIDVADNAVLLVGSLSTANETLQNVVSGDGGLEINSAGSITLAADNRFTGGTRVSSGTLVGDLNAFGSGAIDLATDARLRLTQAASGTLSNIISGDGGVDVSSSGTVTLAAANSYAGGTSVVAGTLAGQVDAFGSSGISLAGAATLLVQSAASQGVTLQNDVSGDGGLVAQASGLISLAGTNSYTGGTRVASGTLAGTVASFGSGDIDVDDAAVLLVGSASAGNETLQNLVAGDGGIQIDSAGTMTLGAVNTFAGGTSVTSGTLTGEYDAFGSGAIDLGVDTTLLLAPAASGALANVVSGEGGVEIQSSSTVNLAAANTYTGGTRVSGGVLSGDIDSFGAGAIDLAADTTLLLAPAASGALANVVSGEGGVEIQSSSTVNLAAANTYTGGTLVSGGVLSGATDAFGSGAIDLATNATLLLLSAADALFDNAVTGNGSLIIDGAGVVDIAQSLSHSSGTRILNGAARVADLAFLGTGGLNLAATGSVILDNNADQNVVTSMSGSGAFTKTGTGTASFSSANGALSGAVDIQAGRVELLNSQGIGSGDINIGSAAIIELAQATDSTFANSLSGAGALIKGGTGTLSLTGANSGFSGAVQVTGGTLAGAAANLGSGSIDVATDAELQVQVSGSESLSNNLLGTGVARVAGTGVLDITGSNSIARLIVEAQANSTAAGLGQSTQLASGSRLNLTVDAGEQSLVLAGAADSTLSKLGAGALAFDQATTLGNLDVASGRVAVNDELTILGANGLLVSADGELSGTGTVAGDVTNNGVLAAGNSIGTLTIDGNYTHNPGASMQVEFDSTSIDLLQVTGTAAINGGTVELLSLDNTEGSGMTFLVADGGVSGNFDNVTLDGATGSVVYSASSVGLPDSMVALMARPSSLNSQITAATEAVSLALGARQDLTALNGDSIAWGYVLAGSQQRDRQDSALGFEVDNRGLVGGIESSLGDSQYYLGLSVANLTGESDLDSRAGDGQVDTDLLSVYGGFGGERFSWRLGFTSGRQSWESQRLTSMNQATEFISSDTEAAVAGVAGHIATHVDLGNWQLSPQLDLRYVRVAMDGYGEDGVSDLALVVGSETFETGYAAAGVDAARSIELSQGRRLTTNLDLAFARVFPMDTRDIDVLFRNSATRYELDADAKARSQLEAGARLTWTLANSIGLTLGYDLSIGQGNSRHQAHAGISARF